jgi:hypothetical protein
MSRPGSARPLTLTSRARARTDDPGRGDLLRAMAYRRSSTCGVSKTCVLNVVRGSREPNRVFDTPQAPTVRVGEAGVLPCRPSPVCPGRWCVDGGRPPAHGSRLVGCGRPAGQTRAASRSASRRHPLADPPRRIRPSSPDPTRVGLRVRAVRRGSASARGSAYRDFEKRQFRRSVRSATWNSW